ncbi:MAG: hypothetical protein H0T42_18705 [Deltaproteobacteria bacterium]|nr:hypothetical protein [Deltaproteobacteria bacterium]
MIAFTARLAAAAPDPRDPHDDDGSLHGPADASVDPAWSDASAAASADRAWSDAGAADGREAARHRGLTGIGRVDLTITWRRTVRVAEMRGTHPADADSMHTIASAIDPVTTARGVLWVLLTWSR